MQLYTEIIFTLKIKNVLSVISLMLCLGTND